MFPNDLSRFAARCPDSSTARSRQRLPSARHCGANDAPLGANSARLCQSGQGARPRVARHQCPCRSLHRLRNQLTRAPHACKRSVGQTRRRARECCPQDGLRLGIAAQPTAGAIEDGGSRYAPSNGVRTSGKGVGKAPSNGAAIRRFPPCDGATSAISAPCDGASASPAFDIRFFADAARLASVAFAVRALAVVGA